MFLYVICAASRLPPHSCLLCGVTDALWLHCVFAKAATAAAFLQLLPSYFDTGRSSAILKPYLCVHNECAPRVRPQTWAPHSSLAHTRQPKARGRRCERLSWRQSVLDIFHYTNEVANCFRKTCATLCFHTTKELTHTLTYAYALECKHTHTHIHKTHVNAFTFECK